MHVEQMERHCVSGAHLPSSVDIFAEPAAACPITDIDLLATSTQSRSNIANSFFDTPKKYDVVDCRELTTLGTNTFSSR